MATSTLGSGTLVLAGTTSGTTTVTATAVAGTTTLTLPAATDTLVGKATTDTLTNKTLTSATLTGVATFDAGTAALPAITTTGDTNTGIFFPAADTIAFSEGGAEVARFNADAQFVAAAGTALLPVITTTGDVNTGMWFPAADTIAFSEGGVESMRIDSSANLQFNSGYGSVATAYGCRAWVNFNGTGTVAIRASGNVSSITDNGTGDYTVNFTTAMPDANYSALVNAGDATFNVRFAFPYYGTAPTTTSIRIGTSNFSGSNFDLSYIVAAIFR